MRGLPIAVACLMAGPWRAVAAEKPGPHGVPEMLAGTYLAKTALESCRALRQAAEAGQSVRVLPPPRALKLRDKPATFPSWHDREGTEGQGFVSTESQPSCVVPMLASEPFEGAPVVDRLTGLMWLGKPPPQPVGVKDVTPALKKVDAGKPAGFSDWRLGTMTELASVALLGPVTFVQNDQWSVDRGAGCTWILSTKGGAALCAQPSRRDTARVQPVRALVPSTAPPPRIKAGLVTSAFMVTECARAEWLRLVEGRPVPIIPTVHPARLRATPATLAAVDLVARLRKLNLHDNGQRCFVNDFRPAADGTVLDAATGLAWEVARSKDKMSWNDAGGYVKKLNQARHFGHDDWRLPTVEEAATLIESVRFLFPETQMDPEWFATSGSIWTADLEPGGKRAYMLDTRTGKLGTLTDTPESVSEDVNFVKMVRSSLKE